MPEINKYAQQQIERIKERCERIKPLVVIHCITYNHEQYICDALDGFVMQKTDFPFVAIVHDDASTDNTAEIIKDYAEKYPDIIFPIFETENQYSKKNGSLTLIMNTACQATGAKYIAMCEGDDYWTDPLKLKKQVAFLEKNLEYSMCFHKVKVLENNLPKVNSYGHLVSDKDYYIQEILYQFIVPTCAVLTRTECVYNCPKHKNFIVGDNVLWTSCASYGKIKGSDESMAVYRRVSDGWTARSYSSRKLAYETTKKWIEHYRAMKYCFPNINSNIFDSLILGKMATASRIELLLCKPSFFSSFRQYFKAYKYKYIYCFFKSILKRFSLLFTKNGRV